VNAVSIGIIGGADGPTSILIAGPALGTVCLMLGAALAAAAVAIWLIIRRRKNKKKQGS